MKFKNILSWAMVASVFMDDFIILRYTIPFDFYVYYLVFIVSIIYYVRSKKTLNLIPGWFAISIFSLIASTLFICVQSGSFSLGVVKQIGGLLFTSIAYYTFIAYNNFEIKRIFRMYIFLAFFVALEGLLEEFLNMNGIHINSKMRVTDFGLYRIFGIMGEPYFLAVVILPALFYTFSKSTNFERFNSKFNNGTLLAAIGLCFILTFSSAGVIGIGGVILFWLYNKKFLSLTSWKIIFLPVLLLLIGYSFSSIQTQWKEFNIKYTQTLGAFTSNSTKKEDIEKLNTSSFALYSNFIIAKESFSERPLTGSGLGTHEENYRKYFSKYFDSDFVIRYGIFNTADANSLFVRLMSETGLLGMGLFFTFLFKNFLRKKGYDDVELRDYTLINQGIFILMLVRLVRTGNYFGNGFFLFFFIYYFSYKMVKKKMAEKKRMRLQH
jgi:hypothetical protein